MTETIPLRTQSNIDDPDVLYELLVRSHAGLDADASAALNARLVLVLANHVGDLAVVRDAVELAQRTLRRRSG